MPANYEVRLTAFRFPRDLPGKRANFRMVAEVRYVSSRGEHDTHHAVLPDLERLWECDPARIADPQFARGEDEGSFASLDMAKVDEWDRLVMLVRAESVHSVQVKVFDIDRPNFFDRLGDALGDVVRAVLGRGKAGLPSAAGVFADALGNASDDIESALLTRLAGGDRLLFRGSARLTAPGDYRLTGAGEAGEYEVQLELTSED
jgi:hypothetical protein